MQVKLNDSIMVVLRRSILTEVVHTKDICITQEQLSKIDTFREPIETIVPGFSKETINFLVYGFTQDEWDAFFNG